PPHGSSYPHDRGAHRPPPTPGSRPPRALAPAPTTFPRPPVPFGHPPRAATKTRAPLAILFDDGWTAASTWEARLRTADDIIMRAADDRRAVALLPLSQGPRDISLETADSARARLHQIKPVPYRIDPAEA